MKNLDLNKSLTLALLMTSPLIIGATAAPGLSAEVWTGTGQLFDRDLNPISDYSIRVERTPEDAERTRTHVIVTRADGTVAHEDHCLSTRTERGWTNACDQTNGSGSCLGEGLCISYETDGQGRAFASTLVFDGADATGRPHQMRILRTELLNGEAVRFFREKLVLE